MADEDVADADVSGGPRLGSADWSAACERVRTTADYIDALETARQTQRLREQETLTRMAAEIAAANVRAQEAERQLREARQQASAVIGGLEQRLAEAEQRAGAAEAWLARLADEVRANLVFG